MDVVTNVPQPSCGIREGSEGVVTQLPTLVGTTWAHVWYLDVEGVGEQHGESVDAHTEAPGGREPILERRQKSFVNLHRLVITCRPVLKRTNEKTRCPA